MTVKSERCLLIDFENVQQINLSKIAEDIQVTIFIGCSQKTIPFELVQAAQRLGKRLEWLKVEGQGSNALDFHIAFYLGRHSIQSPKTDYFILSRDNGFDPLIQHLKKKGLCCKRIQNLTELAPEYAPTIERSLETNYMRVLAVFEKGNKQARPKSRATLTKHISSIFGKKIAVGEIEHIIALLFAEGKLSEADSILHYHF
jgi:hypothetical protein